MASGLTSDKEVLKATVKDADGNEMTGAEYVAQHTIKNIQRYAAAEQMFSEMGGSFDEAKQAEIDAAVDAQWQRSEASYVKNGIGYESLKAWGYNSYKEDALLDMLYGQQGTQPATDEELTAYAEENFVRSTYLLLPYFDMSTFKSLSEEDQKTVEGWAGEIAQRVQEGGELKAVAGEYLPKLGELLGADLSADDIDSYLMAGSLLTYDGLSTYLGAEAIEEIRGMKPGETKALKSSGYNYGSIVYTKGEVFDDATSLDDVREVALYGLKGDELEELLLEKGAQAAQNLDQKAMDTYSPKKIK